MFKFPVYININELLGQFMSITSTYQFYVSTFFYFFDMTHLCVYTLDISTLTKTEFLVENFKVVRHSFGFGDSMGKALIHAV
ncbi:MAG: hypothetical protein DSY85_09895 [Marinomonas sp.]|nr:MAG: hypothetical protein DSY85_09895 [Marinomonas sp.]